MFQRIIDDLKEDTGTALRMTSIAMAGTAALSVAVAFLSAAAFVYVLRIWGLIEALIAVSVIFIVIALILFAVYAAKKRRMARRAAEAAKSARDAAKSAKSAASSLLSDPAMMVTALQIARTIGLKKVIPLIAIAGVALGYFATRGESGEDTDDEAEQA